MGLGGDTVAGLTLGLDRGDRTAVRRVAAIGAAVVGTMPVRGAASAAPAGPRTGGVHIETLTIHVSVQSGGDQTTSRRIDRDIAAEVRRRLHDAA